MTMSIVAIKKSTDNCLHVTEEFDVYEVEVVVRETKNLPIIATSKENAIEKAKMLYSSLNSHTNSNISEIRSVTKKPQKTAISKLVFRTNSGYEEYLKMYYDNFNEADCFDLDSDLDNH